MAARDKRGSAASRLEDAVGQAAAAPHDPTPKRPRRGEHIASLVEQENSSDEVLAAPGEIISPHLSPLPPRPPRCLPSKLATRRLLLRNHRPGKAARGLPSMKCLMRLLCPISTPAPGVLRNLNPRMGILMMLRFAVPR